MNSHRSGLARIRTWLERPGVLWLAVGLGILLTLPTLTSGLYFDDHMIKFAVQGHPAFPNAKVAPLDLFGFMKAGEQEYLEIIDRFAGVWGMTDDFQIAFLRPLSSLTHALDYGMWPDQPWVMHLENVVLYGVLVLVVSVLYRRFLGATSAAGLAMVLYAIDDAHGISVGWISNRNALISGILGVLCLLAHNRWRRDAWRPGQWLGPCLLAVALLAGESAVAVCAYLVAYAWILDDGVWISRISSLASYTLVVVTWRCVYILSGYGVAGTDLYVDPGKEPMVFLAALLERLPVLLLSQFALPPAELWILVSNEGRFLLTSAGLAFLAVVLYLTFPVLKQKAEIRFFAVGAFLATVPICATYPFDRLLIFVGIGAMPLVATFLDYLLEGDVKARSAMWKIGAFALAATWLVIHVFISPILLPGKALLPARYDGIMNEVSKTLPSDDVWSRQTLVVVNAPDVTMSFYVIARKASRLETLPAYVRFLSMTDGELEIERENERTLTIRWPDGLHTRPIDRFFRGKRFPYALGDSFRLTGFVARVTALTEDGRPAEARFEFDVPLEDPSLRWFSWKGKGYTPFVPPSVGEQITFPRVKVLF